VEDKFMSEIIEALLLFVIFIAMQHLVAGCFVLWLCASTRQDIVIKKGEIYILILAATMSIQSIYF